MEKKNENRRADLLADRRKRCEEFANGVINAFWACKDSNELRDCVYTLIYAELLRERRAAVNEVCAWIIDNYLGDYVTDEQGNGGLGDNIKLAAAIRDTMKANEI